MPKPRREKSWYWIPFIGAIIISIIVVSEIVYLKTPKVGVWHPPDTENIIRAVALKVLMVIIFTVQGINGLYQYNKQKVNRDT